MGLADDAVLATGPRAPATSGAEVAARVRDLAPRLGGACFAEGYVDGREFNLSVISGSASGPPGEGGDDGDGGPRVLPPAEIEFVDYPAGKPRIVGYAAKWDPGSFECDHTVRTFDFAAADARAARRAGSAWPPPAGGASGSPATPASTSGSTPTAGRGSWRPTATPAWRPTPASPPPSAGPA